MHALKAPEQQGEVDAQQVAPAPQASSMPVGAAEPASSIEPVPQLAPEHETRKAPEQPKQYGSVTTLTPVRAKKPMQEALGSSKVRSSWRLGARGSQSLFAGRGLPAGTAGTGAFPEFLECLLLTSIGSPCNSHMPAGGCDARAPLSS